MSVQTVETNEVSMSLWHQEKGMETGKATLRSRAWLRGQQKVGERLMVCSQEEARDQFLQSASSHHLLQSWHHALVSAGSIHSGSIP